MTFEQALEQARWVLKAHKEGHTLEISTLHHALIVVLEHRVSELEVRVNNLTASQTPCKPR